METATSIRGEVQQIFGSRWSTRDGRKVPDLENISLKNDGVYIDATVLYADLSGSTDMVDALDERTAAEVYKAYLWSAAKIIEMNGGVITAYDGDRVMAVYIGDSKNSDAGRTALKINWAVHEIINPEFKRVYTSDDFVVRQVVGIDTCNLFVARTGVRGSNDLVWVGRAANYAAKLSGMDTGYSSLVTQDVFDRLNEDSKYRAKDNSIMWEVIADEWIGNQRIYGSNWSWSI